MKKYFTPRALSYSIIQLFNLTFQSLEVVSLYCDTQLKVTEKIVICEIKYQHLSVFQDLRGLFYF